MKIILTHDIDSIAKPLRHVFKVRDRFSRIDLIKHIFNIHNLYDNIENLMDLEDRWNVKSTFFVPVTLFPLEDIKDKLSVLAKEGWEVALHFVYEPLQTKSLLEMEKKILDDIVEGIEGVRTHYLATSQDLIDLYCSTGLRYDSSLRADEVGTLNPYYILPELVEIPIAIMDADLFGRLRMSEKVAWRYIMDKMTQAEKDGYNFFTLIFHQESLYMKGGRLYNDLLRFLNENDFETLRCIDALG